MGFSRGKFYEFDGVLDGYKYEGNYVCDSRYGTAWGFRPITENFGRRGDGGFFLRDRDHVSHREIFREMEIDQKKEMFRFAMKIAACGDIDSNMCGSDVDTVNHFEFEYKLFSKLWDIPISEEGAWLNQLDSDPYSISGIPEEKWQEDEDIVSNALCKMRMVKQYLAEMKINDKNSTTG